MQRLTSPVYTRTMIPHSNRISTTDTPLVRWTAFPLDEATPLPHPTGTPMVMAISPMFLPHRTTSIIYTQPLLMSSEWVPLLVRLLPVPRARPGLPCITILLLPALPRVHTLRRVRHKPRTHTQDPLLRHMPRRTTVKVFQQVNQFHTSALVRINLATAAIPLVLRLV